MRYIAMLFITAFMLFGGQQAFAYDNKDGEAVITFYGDTQGKKYYSGEFGCTDVERGLIFYITYPDVTNERILNDMDSAKISIPLGDIKIASKHKLILNNETPDRLAFTLGLYGEDNAKEICVHGSFIIIDKTNGSNKKYSNALLCYSFNDISIEINNDKKYQKGDIVITTTNETIISLDDKGVILYKDGYQFSFGLDPVYCSIQRGQ